MEAGPVTRTMTPRRREVLDAAAKLFHERGYMGTSMDHVADAVGLTKGSLYHHFPGKAQILSEIYEEAADFVLTHIERHPDDAPPSDIVRSLIRDIVVLIGERRYHVTVFYQEMRWVAEWLPPDDAARVQGKMRRYIEYVESVLRRGMASGEFADLDVTVTAYALIGMASWTYQWYDPRRSLSVDEVTDIFAGIFLRGIART
jgi:AcrR family transcriptional regulator